MPKYAVTVVRSYSFTRIVEAAREDGLYSHECFALLDDQHPGWDNEGKADSSESEVTNVEEIKS